MKINSQNTKEQSIDMNQKTIGIISSIAILTNIIWILLMMLMEGNAPVFKTLGERISFIESKAILYKLSYLNAALLTVIGILFMTSLYIYSRKKNEFWPTIALVFIPIYGILNLFSYLSQVFIVPALLNLYKLPESKEISSILLNLTLHNWHGSIVESLNGLAYAILGIPSIIFPILIMRKPLVLACGGIMLMTSGVLAIIAFLGTLVSTQYLTSISIIGGILATLANFPIAYHYLFSKNKSCDQL
jgi:hypothetical protein